MGSRSLKVHPQFLESVKVAYEEALISSRCSSELEFASSIPLPVNTNRDKKDEKQVVGMSRDTLKKFLDGKPIDRPFFYAICDRIGKKESDIGITGDADPDLAVKEQDRLLDVAFAPVLKGGELAIMPGVIDADYVDVRDEQQNADQGSKTTSSISIEQETGTNEGFMFGHSGQVNINQAGQSQPSEPEGQKAADAEPVVPQTAKSVKQSAKINKGFMFGSSDQVNIHSEE